MEETELQLNIFNYRLKCAVISYVISVYHMPSCDHFLPPGDIQSSHQSNPFRLLCNLHKQSSAPLFVCTLLILGQRLCASLTLCGNRYSSCEEAGDTRAFALMSTSSMYKHPDRKSFTRHLPSSVQAGMHIVQPKPAVSTGYENTHLRSWMKKGKRMDGCRNRALTSSRFCSPPSLRRQLHNVPMETKQRRKQTSSEPPQRLRCQAAVVMSAVAKSSAC